MKRARPDDEESDFNAPAEEKESSNVPTTSASTRRKCPYLDTVNRQLLDFDMEKLCCVTLTNMNVYACLVCGKFFQGRGQGTPGNIFISITNFN
jgi:U4/U6.U5 tri-snRNP-associated protein 2